MSQQPRETPPDSPASGIAVSWVLVGVLAAIAVASFALEGDEQSSAIIAALILGLVGIFLTLLRADRNNRR